MITVKTLEEYNGGSSQMLEKQKNRPRYTEAVRDSAEKAERHTYKQMHMQTYK